MIIWWIILHRCSLFWFIYCMKIKDKNYLLEGAAEHFERNKAWKPRDVLNAQLWRGVIFLAVKWRLEQRLLIRCSSHSDLIWIPINRPRQDLCNSGNWNNKADSRRLAMHRQCVTHFSEWAFLHRIVSFMGSYSLKNCYILRISGRKSSWYGHENT